MHFPLIMNGGNLLLSPSLYVVTLCCTHHVYELIFEFSTSVLAASKI